MLEVNSRHSQSHAELFEWVDGAPNHQVMVELGLGREPDFPHRRGRYPVAAKWFLCHFSDGVVTRAPSAEKVAQLEREVPGVHVDLVAREGDRLSEIMNQDSYSYDLAHLYIGGDDEEQLTTTYEKCVTALGFEVEDTPHSPRVERGSAHA